MVQRGNIGTMREERKFEIYMVQAVTQEVDRKGKIELLSRMHRNVIVCCPLTFQRVTVGCTFVLHLA
jgi:hypothetical protein